MANLTFHVVSGDMLLPFIDDLARLRIHVFREWPYLYDGTVEYEADYLKHYADSERSAVVLAYDGDLVVGASTALPLIEADASFTDAFKDTEYNPESIFYFGESVLLSEFRGAGVGNAFFHYRELNAREQGYEYAAFCAVERALDDARRPKNYRPLDEMWMRKGFVKQPQICARFPWKEINSEGEVPHELCFWLKRLN